MNLGYIRTHSGKGKLAIIVLGIIVLIVGLLSHYESHWRKLYNRPNDEMRERKKDVPRLSIEEYYVAMIIIFLILSLVSIVGSFVIGMSKGRVKLIDFGYHILAALLLLIAGSLYISSAKKIGVLELEWDNGDPMILLLGLKYFAGSLTIIQTILYCVVAIFIWKEV
ncbi:hypothetical protein Ocin01_16024 [Orchesella cincta]|uniref:Uncharacterized protein n=1 Tax=Orchesella cincta TaxID=48709 RepID=A0A1D2MCN0_ORCCI|nr:hypothetical protein Ocin01_16024 [Orchesella cincta]